MAIQIFELIVAVSEGIFWLLVGITGSWEAFRDLNPNYSDQLTIILQTALLSIGLTSTFWHGAIVVYCYSKVIRHIFARSAKLAEIERNGGEERVRTLKRKIYARVAIVSFALVFLIVDLIILDASFQAASTSFIGLTCLH